MFIDTHVHFRDFKQAHKETVKHGLEVARDSGVDAVFDMPNTDPPITTEEVLQDRLRLARDAHVPEVFYGVYLGLTADPEQVKRVVALSQKYQQVVGLKLYAGHSVGNLGVVQPDQQRTIYEVLAREGFHGVLVVHAEKESCMDHEKWNPSNPMSHTHARPPRAEVESVRDQIAFAQETDFRGKLHIAHISTDQAVYLVADAKKRGSDISCAACPHHLVYNRMQMKGKKGLLWKMNPPLRHNAISFGLMSYLRRGMIDWIETDHAPHTLADKMQPPYMSGIPGLPWWPLFDLWLQRRGFSQAQREDLTFNNAARRFGLDITRSNCQLRDRTADYPFNPYQKLEERLRQ